MPVPLAAGLYGVLLGLGFTTFILSFAVWALAGISVALGEPQTGLLIGLAFGAGRALPVIGLAPSGGGSLHAAMAERPRILRSLRALDALALAGTAAALAVTPAQAAVKVTASGYSDISVDGLVFALHKPGAAGELRSPAGVQPLPGNHPAVGGGRLAYIEGPSVVVQGVAPIPAPGADALAVSTYWVAWRAAGALYAASLDPTQTTQPVAVLIGNVGKPSLAGSVLVFELDGRIETYDLATGTRTVMRQRVARRAARTVGPRQPPDLRARDLQASTGDDGPVLPAQGHERPHALRHDADRPARQRPRGRPLPREGSHQQAAVGTPAEGRPRHADHDGDRGHRRLRHPRPPAARRQRHPPRF